MITKWMNHLRRQGGLHKEKQEHNNGSRMAKPKKPPKDSPLFPFSILFVTLDTHPSQIETALPLFSSLVL